MQVLLKNDWFDANGKIWPKGQIEYNGDPDALPSSAKIDGKKVSRKETPPAIEGELPISAIATHNAELIEGKLDERELPLTVPKDKLQLDLNLGEKTDSKKK